MHARSLSQLRPAILIGAGVVAFLMLGFYALSRKALDSNWLEGAIVEKSFTPAPEQQIDVGSGGVRQREVKGTYRLIVKGDDGRDYTVFVGEPAFATHTPGGRIRFLRPPPEPVR